MPSVGTSTLLRHTFFRYAKCRKMRTDMDELRARLEALSGVADAENQRLALMVEIAWRDRFGSADAEVLAEDPP